MKALSARNIARACEGFVNDFARDTAVLYAGTNLPNPSLQCIDSTALGMMPAIGAFARKQQPNVEVLGRLEHSVEARLRSLFGGVFADARPLSASLANLAIFCAFLTGRRNTVLSLSPECGGHPSQNEQGVLAHMRAHVVALPFAGDEQRLDAAEAARLISRLKPRLVIYGPSTLVRASEIERVVAAARRVGAPFVFDASHVAGLIAGGMFPNPLDAGADFLTASTYKTLACPPGGFIVGASRKWEEPVRAAVSPVLHSNYDAQRLLRLRFALDDVAAFHRDYSVAVLENARALREALVSAGLTIVSPCDGRFGTHQVLVELGGKQRTATAVNRLHAASIATSACRIPGAPQRWALRLGTQLIARRGMRSAQTRILGEVIADVLRGGAAVKARRAVSAVCEEFQGVKFCSPVTVMQSKAAHSARKRT